MGTRERAGESLEPLTEDVLNAINLPSATVHEAYGTRGAMPPRIRPVHPTMRVCGQAVTVRCPVGDNLRIHHAMYLAQAGDVVVVSVDDDEPFGYWGEIMTVAAQVRGLGGLVIDGCVRDHDQLVEHGFPVFAAGLCIRGTKKDPSRDGAINAPIRIGDIDIFPGDVVVGDADGVVAVKRADVAEVAASSAAREASEVDIIARLRSGERTIDMFGSKLSDLSK